MKATVIIDNTGADEMQGEWGLCIYIEYNGKTILLDSGSSDLYLENAKKLGCDLEKVDMAVLSHGHYDHGNGFPSFFEKNKKAKLYLRDNCGENCYAVKEGKLEYIGLPEGLFEKYGDRIVKCEGRVDIDKGISLIPHKGDLKEVGEREKMFVKVDGELVTDEFCHEQSLVFDTDKGKVIFNSCCHAGADRVIAEIKDEFPGEKIYALIGGFHLFNKTKEEVKNFANRVKDTGIEYLCTGHCTGDEAYAILEEVLKDKVHHFKVGLQFEF
ncbi:MAG: MBL fold metallo-hydrolase [Eubacterium sp.]|nr:MBL fold metallo-hydrolase [Eubacterium sp.]